jgi:hypothetical protein
MQDSLSYIPQCSRGGKSSSQLRKKTRGQRDDLLYKDSLLRPSSKMVSLD